MRRTRAESDDPLRDWEKSPLVAITTVIDLKICGPAATYACDVLGALERWPADELVVDAGDPAVTAGPSTRWGVPRCPRFARGGGKP